MRTERIARLKKCIVPKLFLNLIENYGCITELDRTILSELIDKITIGEAREVDGIKKADVTIYYHFVGAVSRIGVE